MTKWTAIGTADRAAVPGHEAPGVVTSRGVRSRMLSPNDFGLWLCASELDDGSTLTIDDAPSDQAVYVVAGAVDVDDAMCGAGGAVIIEQGATASFAARGSTHLAHFGSTTPTGSGGGGIHVVGPEGMFRSGEREGVHAIWFADGTCDTCSIQAFTVAGPGSGARGRAHSHSEDEIIYLLDGQFSLGAHTIEPGTAVSIPADVRYAITRSTVGHRFLNVRRDISTQIYADDGIPIAETALARGGHATNAGG